MYPAALLLTKKTNRGRDDDAMKDYGKKTWSVTDYSWGNLEKIVEFKGIDNVRNEFIHALNKIYIAIMSEEDSLAVLEDLVAAVKLCFYQRMAVSGVADRVDLRKAPRLSGKGAVVIEEIIRQEAAVPAGLGHINNLMPYYFLYSLVEHRLIEQERLSRRRIGRLMKSRMKAEYPEASAAAVAEAAR